MPARTTFTEAEVKKYITQSYCTPLRKIAIERALEICVHADGLFPEKLLRDRRPNEPEEVREYRCKVFQPVTKPKFSEIISSLQKIRRSSEWVIKYPTNVEFTKIQEGEDLRSYCEYNFPLEFTSLTNWMFSVHLKKNLVDPNAVIFIAPLETEVDETEFLQPFPRIFDIDCIVDYREGDYAVLLNKESCTYIEEGAESIGNTYYFVTRSFIWEYTQTSGSGAYVQTMEYNHDLGFLPVYKIKGIVDKQINDEILYESRISGCIPEFNEAIREYSDLSGSKVGHMYPERWEFSNSECADCKGSGHVHNPRWTADCGCPDIIDCPKCEGRGYKIGGPFAKLFIKGSNLLDGQTVAPPIPPAGYIQKDTAVLKMQEDSFDGHCYKALSAINFQFLEETPANESGLAKSVDKDELNNFVHSIAEDLVWSMDKIMRTIAFYRYKGLYSDNEINSMLPKIPVPETFDLLNVEYLEQEVITAKKGNIHPAILNTMELELAEKRITDDLTREIIEISLRLNPLPNIAEADKVLMLQNDGITQETYVISCNILEFVQRAINENNSFTTLAMTKQKEIITKYAQDQIAANKPSTQIKTQLIDSNGNPIPEVDSNGNPITDPNAPVNG